MIKKLNFLNWVLLGLILFLLSFDFVFADPEPLRCGGLTCNLASSDEYVIINWAIDFIMGLVGITTTVMVIYAGVLFVTHYGEEEAITKAKTLLTYAIVGIVIIVFSYSLIWAITEIRLNRN